LNDNVHNALLWNSIITCKNRTTTLINTHRITHKLTQYKITHLLIMSPFDIICWTSKFVDIIFIKHKIWKFIKSTIMSNKLTLLATFLIL
jgi:hypothetical protein